MLGRLHNGTYCVVSEHAGHAPRVIGAGFPTWERAREWLMTFYGALPKKGREDQFLDRHARGMLYVIVFDAKEG